MDDWDNKPGYHPVFLEDGGECHDDEGPSRSIHAPKSKSHSTFSLDDFLGYPAKTDDLRIISPYKYELKSVLGDDIFVLTSKGGASLDSVPEELVRKKSPMLLKLQGGGAVGYCVVGDKKSFYFKDEDNATRFIQYLSEPSGAASFEEHLKDHTRLKDVTRTT